MIGDVVREARRRAGLSQRQLAGLLGIAQPNISELERDHGRWANPSLKTLRKLADALDCDLVIILRPRPCLRV